MFFLSLEHLYLNKNKLSRIFHSVNGNESPKKSSDPFPSLRCLLLGNHFKCYAPFHEIWPFISLPLLFFFAGANNIGDLASVDALNVFPKLVVLIFCSVIL